LFDLDTDPDEFHDLGRDPAFEDTRRQMKDRLLNRLLSRKNRVTMTDDGVAGIRDSEDASGILIGVW
jgi:hypothetical protein